MKPIIFSTELIPKILDGSKTMTRRVIKLPPSSKDMGWEFKRLNYGTKALFWPMDTETDGIYHLVPCPYGQVGDGLWVRETWRINAIGGISYKADEGDCWIGKWKSPIHMFRKDSRITLEITEVRVERVQEIKATDALKEGIKLTKPYIYADLKVLADFKDLWDSLNAKRGYGWDTNCWVRVTSFRRV